MTTAERRRIYRCGLVGQSKGTSASLVLDVADYTAKNHSVTFTGWLNGSYLSSGPIPFTVDK